MEVDSLPHIHLVHSAYLHFQLPFYLLKSWEILVCHAVQEVVGIAVLVFFVLLLGDEFALV